MSKASSQKGQQASDISWDMMIEDAEKQIEDLRFSIEVFRRRKSAGEPVPVKLKKGA